MPELKLNDVVKVYVEEQENVKGQLILQEEKQFRMPGIKFKRH